MAYVVPGLTYCMVQVVVTLYSFSVLRVVLGENIILVTKVYKIQV